MTHLLTQSNRFMTAVIILLLFPLLFSCSTEDRFQRKDMVNLKRKISGNYSNSSVKKRDYQPKLFSFFNLKKEDSVVGINTEKNKLYVNYLDASGKKHCMAFDGKFKRKSFEFYLEYKTILAPPILISTQKQKIILTLNNNADLVLYHEFDNSGMLFIMGAGHTGRNKYTFTKIN